MPVGTGSVVYAPGVVSLKSVVGAATASATLVARSPVVARPGTAMAVMTCRTTPRIGAFPFRGPRERRGSGGERGVHGVERAIGGHAGRQVGLDVVLEPRFGLG